MIGLHAEELGMEGKEGGRWEGGMCKGLMQGPSGRGLGVQGLDVQGLGMHGPGVLGHGVQGLDVQGLGAGIKIIIMCMCMTVGSIISLVSVSLVSLARVG